MDWYPKSPTDYRNDTWRLSLAAHGAYNLLLDHYYLYEAPLPIDDRALASIVGCSLEDWQNVRDEVVPLFKKRNALLTHTRCEAELEAAYIKRRDGAARQKRHRKALTSQDGVTRPSRVSHAPRGEERTGEDSRASLDMRARDETTDLPAKVNGQVYMTGFDVGWESWRSVDMMKGSKQAARAAWEKHVVKPQLDPRPILRAASAYCLQCALTETKTRHMVTWINQHGWNDQYDESILRREDAMVARQRAEMDAAWRRLYDDDATTIAITEGEDDGQPSAIAGPATFGPIIDL